MAITTWNGVSNTSSNDASKAPISQQKITIQLAGSRQACERFCDGLKKGLKNAVADVGKLTRRLLNITPALSRSFSQAANMVLVCEAPTEVARNARPIHEV